MRRDEILMLALLSVALIAVAWAASPRHRSGYRPRLDEVRPKRNDFTS